MWLNNLQLLLCCPSNAIPPVHRHNIVEMVRMFCNYKENVVLHVSLFSSLLLFHHVRVYNHCRNLFEDELFEGWVSQRLCNVSTTVAGINIERELVAASFFDTRARRPPERQRILIIQR